MMPGGRLLSSVVVSTALVVAASCGDGDDATSPTPAATGGSPATAGSVTAASVPAVDVADACVVVPSADIRSVTGFAVDDGVAAGDERRRVCTFRDETAAVGITVGIEAGSRFDEKAAVSQQSLDDEGEEIESLGDRALFFFSDEDLPEGVGGVLVAVGDLTIDVTLQGLPEDAMRDASANLAELAVSNL
jgi:hypothetical protein